MHDETPRDDRFWNLVATFIDRPNLEDLRREWKDDARFIEIATHVSTCISCLERRHMKLKAWHASGPVADEAS
ncbi:MAG: hypothetical protein HYU37_09780 [Acidobacteria bacterium]|nr:hypothetical protein [Acidobacteriota bacterium]